MRREWSGERWISSSGISWHPMKGGAIDIAGARENLELMMERTRNAILALPVIPLSQVFEDGAPFEFYLWLRAVCSTARSRFALIDPYVSPDVFHRYLDAVSPGVKVTVVTVQANSKNWPALLSVARLYDAQHPFELREDPAPHDRYVLADDQAYSVTASVKDAAVKASCEVKAAADVNHVDGLIAAAKPIAI